MLPCDRLLRLRCNIGILTDSYSPKTGNIVWEGWMIFHGHVFLCLLHHSITKNLIENFERKKKS